MVGQLPRPGRWLFDRHTFPTREAHRMALTQKQLWIAGKIDTRMQKLLRGGKDNMAIVAAMTDRMPAFHQLLETIQSGDMDQLTRKFPGFYRYAMILESLATGIRSGAIPVPGRQEATQQTKPVNDHRQRAAAMDLRMRQLTEEGVPRSAIVDRMTGYVPDLGRIWNATSDEQLAALCRAYPGFHAYATLMEEAAEAERQKPVRAYDDLAELPDALKQQLSSLLGTAAKLERDYRSVLDAAGASAPREWRLPLSKLQTQWEADLAHFREAIQVPTIPQQSRDVVLPTLERMAQQIAKLQARLEAS